MAQPESGQESQAGREKQDERRLGDDSCRVGAAAPREFDKPIDPEPGHDEGFEPTDDGGDAAGGVGGQTERTGAHGAEPNGEPTPATRRRCRGG